jgi:hypothetical protein
LHFDVPAVSQLAHAELKQCMAPDGTQRAHIGIAHPV